MATRTEEDIEAQEREELELASQGGEALDKLIEELSDRSRRRRQFSARVTALLAKRSPELLVPHIPDLIDALYRPEAQTRWEVLDALTSLASVDPETAAKAYDGAETSLFDEESGLLRVTAFRYFTTMGTQPGWSTRVWPLLDEALQCYHGDQEFPGMLDAVAAFAQEPTTDASVRAALAERMKFDAQSSKGALSNRARQIIEICRK